MQLRFGNRVPLKWDQEQKRAGVGPQQALRADVPVESLALSSPWLYGGGCGTTAASNPHRQQEHLFFGAAKPLPPFCCPRPQVQASMGTTEQEVPRAISQRSATTRCYVLLDASFRWCGAKQNGAGGSELVTFKLRPTWKSRYAGVNPDRFL